MVTFRNNNNNNRRNNFRRSDRNFKLNGERQKYSSSFSNNENFKRKAPGRNNHNAPKLIEKYNDLAREALSNGDKILSENYLQHADHFTRIFNEREVLRKDKFIDSKTENKIDTDQNSHGSNEQASNIINKKSQKELSEEIKEKTQV